MTCQPAGLAQRLVLLSTDKVVLGNVEDRRGWWEGIFEACRGPLWAGEGWNEAGSGSGGSGEQAYAVS